MLAGLVHRSPAYAQDGAEEIDVRGQSDSAALLVVDDSKRGERAGCFVTEADDTSGFQ